MARRKRPPASGLNPITDQGRGAGKRPPASSYGPLTTDIGHHPMGFGPEAGPPSKYTKVLPLRKLKRVR